MRQLISQGMSQSKSERKNSGAINYMPPYNL